MYIYMHAYIHMYTCIHIYIYYMYICMHTYIYTIPKICTAIKTSRSNTVPGLDGIPTQVHQLCELEEDVLNILTSHSILSDNDNTVPDRWKHSIIISIQKKGNSTSLENQRGIAVRL